MADALKNLKEMSFKQMLTMFGSVYETLKEKILDNEFLKQVIPVINMSLSDFFT